MHFIVKLLEAKDKKKAKKRAQVDFYQLHTVYDLKDFNLLLISNWLKLINKRYTTNNTEYTRKFCSARKKT